MPLGRVQKTKISITKIIIAAIIVVALEVWYTTTIVGDIWINLDKFTQIALMILYGIIALIIAGFMAIGMKMSMLWNQ